MLFDDEWLESRKVPKTLIFSQCLIRTEEQGRLLGVSLELTRRLNPGCDILLMDNASPLEPLKFIPLGTLHTLHRFPDSIGHFSPKYQHEMPNPKDGPGRAIMTALQIARDSGYDRACYLESDVLYAKPIEWGFERMTKPTACLPRTVQGYLDWSPWWIADLEWLVDDCQFIKRYDWPNQKGGPGNEGERQYERLLAGGLEVLPVKGGRGDGMITAHNLRILYPDGIDFITHVDTACFREFLILNGHSDLAEKL